MEHLSGQQWQATWQAGYDNAQEQNVIIIPITSRTPSGEEGYTKENEITVINFDKSKNKLYVKYVL